MQLQHRDEVFEALRKVDLSEISNPNVKMIKKILPAPMLSSSEINWDPDVGQKMRNEALYALCLRNLLQHEREEMFRKFHEQKELEKISMIVAELLKKESEEKIKQIADNEEIMKSQMTAMQDLLDQLKADPETMAAISEVLTALDNIRRIDEQIVQIDNAIAELQTQTHQQAMNMIQAHSAAENLQPTQQNNLCNFVFEQCQKIDKNRFFSETVSNPTVNSPLPAYVDSLSSIDQLKVNAKIQAVLNNKNIFLRDNYIEKPHQSFENLLANLVALQHAKAQTEFKLLVIKDGLIHERHNQVEILDKCIQKLSDKRPNIMDEFDFLGVSKAAIQATKNSTYKPESTSQKARM